VLVAHGCNPSYPGDRDKRANAVAQVQIPEPPKKRKNECSDELSRRDWLHTQGTEESRNNKK
jgi:hypothetical protein